MSIFSVGLRLMLNFLTRPDVQGALKTAGRQIVAAGTRAFIKAVREGRILRKTPMTVK